MKKLTISLVVVFFIGISAFFAQNPQGKGAQQGNQDQQNKRNEMNELVKANLNLSVDQTKKWDEIHRSYFDSMDALRKDEGLSQEEKKSHGKELRKSKDDAINAILTDEQIVELAELRKEMREENRNGNAGPNKGDKKGQRNGEGHASKVKEELNLSEDQSAKWDQIQNTYQQKIKVVMSDDSVDNEFKHESKNALRDEMQKELMNILDDDQKAIMKSKRKQGLKQ